MLLVAAAATLGLGRSRGSGDRIAVGLLAGACLMTLLTGAALSGFSWRYQMPQIPLFPMAGALGLAALLRGRSPRAPEPAQPLRPLDRAAQVVTRAPMPASWRRATQSAAARGVIQVVLAVLTGAVAAFAVAMGAVRSGWFMPVPATAAGLGVGVGLVVMALGARVRAGADRARADRARADRAREDRARADGAREDGAGEDGAADGRVAEVAASPPGAGRRGDPPDAGASLR
jgi:hypothetical protein